MVRERLDLSPLALFQLTESSVFLRFSDVAWSLLPYEEQVLLSRMDRKPDATGLSQRKVRSTVHSGPTSRDANLISGHLSAVACRGP